MPVSHINHETLIVFYNTLWGQPLETEGLTLPEGCALTAERSMLDRAAAVVFHLPEIGGVELPRKRRGQLWVAWPMECLVHYPWALDTAFMAQFDLKMTYRLDSDVPVPYFGAEMLAPLRQPPQPKLRGPLAALFISSRLNQSRRLQLASSLLARGEMHSFGRQFQTHKLPEDSGRATKLETIAKYKFTLAFENSIARDYVTEKFFDPLIAGSVPVYLGAPNVGEFAPGERCFINAADFESPERLAAYLRRLDQDDDAYGEYLAWKSRPLRKEFVQAAEAQRQPRFVALCHKILDLRPMPRP